MRACKNPKDFHRFPWTSNSKPKLRNASKGHSTEQQKQPEPWEAPKDRRRNKTQKGTVRRSLPQHISLKHWGVLIGTAPHSTIPPFSSAKSSQCRAAQEAPGGSLAHPLPWAHRFSSANIGPANERGKPAADICRTKALPLIFLQIFKKKVKHKLGSPSGKPHLHQ